MQFLFISCTLALLSTPGQLSAQQQWGGGFDKSFGWSGSADSHMGFAFDSIGDINGDGISEIISGAPLAASASGIANVGLVEIHSGADGSLLFSHTGSLAGDSIGTAVSAAGDANTDGIPDYAFTAGSGDAEIHSGADGSLIWNLVPTGGVFYQEGLAAAGDLNGDNFDDLFVYAHTSFAGATVNAISGADGTILWSQLGPSQYAYTGAITAVADINGDGIRDCLSGGQTYQSGAWTGQAVLLSGSDGSILNTWFEGNSFGFSVAAAGDYDADGFDDFAIGTPWATVGGPGTADGKVSIYSGATFALIRTFSGYSDLNQIGYSVSNVGDVDEDGFPDLVAGTRNFPGKAIVISGQTGATLYVINRPTYSYDYITLAQGLGDLDGDGRLDLLVSAPDFGQTTAGLVSIYSFSDFMTSSASSVSASAGGTIQFQIDFPGDNSIAYPSLSYRLLYSASGMGPTRVYGWNVPLSVDPLWSTSLQGNYPSLFLNPEGLLDADGRAVVTLNLAPGVASPLVGRTLHFCAMQYELTPWNTLYVHGPSRAVALSILP